VLWPWRTMEPGSRSSNHLFGAQVGWPILAGVLLATAALPFLLELALQPAIHHRAELVDTVGNATYLDDPLTNGRPGAVVSVTQNWNPGGGAGVFNDHPVGVFYDEDVDKWAIYNRDGAPMPAGAAFNVAVSGSDEGAS